MAELSVHCIDVSRALPAAGMRVVNRKVDDDAGSISDSILKTTGMLASPIENISSGVNEATFHIGYFYRASGIELMAPGFLEQVPIRFGVADDRVHYQLPLKFTQ